MEKKRSVGIVAVGMLAIVWGAWRLFGNINTTFIALSRFSQIVSAIDLPYTLFATLYYPLFFICLFVGGIAFLFLKKWGKVLMQIGLVIDILVRLYGIITALPLIFTIARIKKISPINGFIFGFEILLINIIILCLIVHPKIEEQFK